MAQLKMYRLPADPVEKLILPEGYTVSNYKTEDDKLAWCEICKNGLVDDDAGKEKFDECITSNSDIKLSENDFTIAYLKSRYYIDIKLKNESAMGELARMHIFEFKVL